MLPNQENSNESPDRAASDVESGNEEKKKKTVKDKMKNICQHPLYPLYVVVICQMCFLLPIAVYSCDVLIGVNVLADTKFGLTLVKSKNNFFNESSAPLSDIGDYDYRHRMQKTVLEHVQRLSSMANERNKRQVSINNTAPRNSSISNTTAQTTIIPSTNNPATVSVSKSTTSLYKGTTASTTKTTTTILTTSTTLTTSTMFNHSQNVSSTSSSFPNVAPTSTSFSNVSEVSTTTDNDTIEWPVESDQYCHHTLYFVTEHEKLSAQTNDSKDLEYDWYVSMDNQLRQYQQALFFLFTVIGLVILLINIGLRVDAFLNEKWSSYFLFMFLMYAISMSLTVKVFALQSGSGGLRCFLCRMVSYCTDIDPWSLQYNVYFPTGFNWNVAALTSIILKIYDSVAIGILTLKYILDLDNDPRGITAVKFIGWLIIFPIMIITPAVGVIRYSVIPVTIPENTSAQLAFEIIFYLGIACWVISFLLFYKRQTFCMNRNNYVEKEEQDEEY